MYLALALQNRPRTSVTAKRNPDGCSALVGRTMMRYALERESYRGSTPAVLVELQTRAECSLAKSKALRISALNLLQKTSTRSSFVM